MVPLATFMMNSSNALAQSSIVSVPSIIEPVLKSIMSFILVYSLVFVDTFITGTAGLPVGVPSPVVNKIKLAPEPARPVVDSTSLPGVHNKFKPGFKFNEYELKGVPIRITIGPNDLKKGSVEIARRDNLSKTVISQEEVVSYIDLHLKEIQLALFDKAKSFREQKITTVDNFEDFKKILDKKGGFISAHWDGTELTEQAIKKETKATIRCIPLDFKEESGKCVYSGKDSNRRVLFARAY